MKTALFILLPYPSHYFVGFSKVHPGHRAGHFSNAARVQFHGMEVVCDIVNKSKTALKNKLERLFPTLVRSPHSTWINPSEISLTDFAK